MNALKKIFLLTLISVSFLSAYSQLAETEILYQVSINRSANPNEISTTNIDDINIGTSTGSINDEIQFDIGYPTWWPFYKYVKSEIHPKNAFVSCLGLGMKLCIIDLEALWNNIWYRGEELIQPEVAEKTYDDIIKESEELAANGVYQGSISKKIAIPGDRTNVVMFTMTWNYDPSNIYDGKAEIIISKTNKLGF